MKSVLSLFCFILILTLSSGDIKYSYQRINNAKSELNSDSLILWQSNKKLTWDHFHGAIDTLSTFKAMTFNKIKVESKIDSEKIIFMITCSFLKKTILV